MNPSLCNLNNLFSYWEVPHLKLNVCVSPEAMKCLQHKRTMLVQSCTTKLEAKHMLMCFHHHFGGLASWQLSGTFTGCLIRVTADHGKRRQHMTPHREK